MATEKKSPRQGTKRSASDPTIELAQMPTTISHKYPISSDFSNDKDLLVPNEISNRAIGLLSCLTTRRLINISFTTLYQRSLKITWLDLLTRERRNLKSNINSVEKCFMINRLIAECTKDPYKFAQQTGELFEEIKSSMSTTFLSTWSAEDFYNQIIIWRRLQCQRRLFHIDYDEINRPQSLLTLQRFVSVLTNQYLNSYRVNPTIDNQNHLKKLLQHSFLIVAQPSIPECVAATKYEKTKDNYVAKLSSRIICLIDPDTIEKYFVLDSINVILYPFDRTVDSFGERQSALKWYTKPITDVENQIRMVLFAELDSISLQKLDIRNTRPLYSAKLCQLQFQIKVKTKEFHIEENLLYLSQPFGLCSHAQYYPEYVAKVLLYEVSLLTQTIDLMIHPDVLTDYLARYHVRIAGVKMKRHTCEYIRNILRIIYEGRKDVLMTAAFGIYEEILAQMISQMEMFIDHPFLAMMYHDGLFLGICNSALDQNLHGTREEPHILLRFNTLSTHQSIQHASVRFIVHNGQLIRATFHAKAFIDEMCRMIAEANSEKAKKIRLLSDTSNQTFYDFISYFDNELFRLDTAAAPMKDAYQPFIPILWNTMRTNTDLSEQQIPSPLFVVKTHPIDLSQTGASSMQVDTPHVMETHSQLPRTTEKITSQIDSIIFRVFEKLVDLLTKSTSPYSTQASTFLSSLVETNITQQKELITQAISECLQSPDFMEMSTQTSSDISSTSISADT
ncbi:hypothetical protein I4U23_025503 [Adineta vaga]|nr:hypothetical protein I4U23_025503 [Adineta vaga]